MIEQPSVPAPRFEVTTIGEAMLRLSVPAGSRLETARHLDLHAAGAEANVTAALSRLGRSCGWVSSLPSTAIGRFVATHLRAAGVDLGAVVWRQTGRLGTYFLEFSLPPRPSQAIYDRADSCAARLRPEEIDWAYLLDTRILHLTGITPALSPGCARITAEAVTRARAAGVPVSFDVNYRQLLWPPAEAARALLPLLQGAALVFCGRRDAVLLFDLHGTPDSMARDLQSLCHADQVVLTAGAEGAYACAGSQVIHQPAAPVVVVDRLGAGDALAAGVVHGWLAGDLALGLRQSTMLAALALSQEGDMLVVNQQELDQLLAGEGETLVR